MNKTVKLQTHTHADADLRLSPLNYNLILYSFTLCRL